MKRLSSRQLNILLNRAAHKNERLFQSVAVVLPWTEGTLFNEELKDVAAPVEQLTCYSAWRRDW